MKDDEIFERLQKIQYEESNFSKVMHAKNVQELIEITANPEELLSYFENAEEFGRIEEESIFYGKTIVQRLKMARPVKRRRAFFI